jgi:hypothetical protein
MEGVGLHETLNINEHEIKKKMKGTTVERVYLKFDYVTEIIGEKI